MALVECLNCGEMRHEQHDGFRRVHLDECCSRCGYVGWAASVDLTESARRVLRERPPARRRLLSVA